MFLSAEFRRSIKPLIIINSICTTGLVEYFVDDKINAIGIIYALFSLFLYLSMTLIFSFSSNYFKHRLPFLLKVTYTLYNFNECLFEIVTIVAGILRRKKVKRFLLQMETCTRSMNQLNIPMNLSQFFRQQCFLVFLSIIILLLMIVTSYRWLLQLKLNIMEMVISIYLERYPFFLLLVTDTTFIFWIRYIKIKFSQLNVVLKRMLTTTINLPQHKRVLQIWNNEKNNDLGESVIHGTNKSDKNIIKLKQIREIHLELIKCAKNINNAYGLHILMSISTGFILIVAVCYNAYNFVKASNYTQHPFQMYAFSYWIFHNGFKIFVISYVCSSAATEFHKDSLYEIIILPSFFFLHATNTGDILCELYEPSTSKEFRKEIHNFTLQLIQNQLSFTACGFFDLDNKLIYCIIGSVTTYLVILIQIGGVPYLIFSTDSTL